MAAQLVATGLGVSHGGRTLFSDLDLVVAPGDVIGLVGPNGAGKSSLLRLLAGVDLPEHGSVSVAPPDANVGWLPQETDRIPGETIADYLGRRTGVTAAQAELDAATEELAAGSPGADDRYSMAFDRWMAIGAAPRDILLPDQFFDRTSRREHHTFFGRGIAAHVTFADPVSAGLRKLLLDETRATGCTVHDGGTYVCMDGPAFSTRAESNANRQLGFDVIGMTNLPEAKLACEAEIALATLAMITDFDCWKVEEEPVTVETIVGHLTANSAKAKEILARVIPRIPSVADWPEHRALDHAILTDRKLWPAATVESLRAILGRFCYEKASAALLFGARRRRSCTRTSDGPVCSRSSCACNSNGRHVLIVMIVVVVVLVGIAMGVLVVGGPIVVG